MKKTSSLLMIIFMTGVACTSTNCKRKDVIPPLPGAQSNNVVAAKSSAPANVKTMFVYKYDGSLQCQTAGGLKVEEMAKELGAIKVYSMENKPDGLMHIALCGSPTGRVNVYEIDVKDLAKAEAIGFKEFKVE